MTGRKTVLVVVDDPGILYVLANGLSNVLEQFDVITASNGLEAVEAIEQRGADALVTDLSLPIMDGFALLAYVTQRCPHLPVVVLAGTAPDGMDPRLTGRGGLRVLRKPVTYPDVAQSLRDAIERADPGQPQGVPLAGVLRLIESERRSCTVIVTSGKRRGRLQFDAGRLVNAFSEDFGAEGEAAAYDVLSWHDTAIEFDDLPHHGLRRLIHTPLQVMLIELATVQEQLRDAAPPAPVAAPPADAGDPADDAPGDDDPSDDDPTAEDRGTVALGDDHRGDDDPGAQDPGAPADEPATEWPADVWLASDGGTGAPTTEDPRRTGPTPATDPGPTAGARDAAEAPRPVTREGDTMRTDEPLDRAPYPEAPPAAAVTATGPELTPAAPEPSAPTSTAAADDAHVTGMVAAIERLTQRARDADAALAAVAAEVELFRAAQRRFDEISAQREQRRRELESFREDVARLAREILGRVDGAFDAMAPEADTADPRPPT